MQFEILNNSELLLVDGGGFWSAMGVFVGVIVISVSPIIAATGVGAVPSLGVAAFGATLIEAAYVGGNHY